MGGCGGCGSCGGCRGTGACGGGGSFAAEVIAFADKDEVVVVVMMVLAYMGSGVLVIFVVLVAAVLIVVLPMVTPIGRCLEECTICCITGMEKSSICDSSAPAACVEPHKHDPARK
jgi:hypothetical protein